MSTKASKFLSLILRHKPENINLILDKYGWGDIDYIIKHAPSDLKLSKKLINQIVNDNDKQRFSLSKDGKKIRANQGHSIAVDLELTSVTPPDILYHGTATRFLDSIFKQGLTSQSRQHVHLSLDKDTATTVGSRHGSVIILNVDAKQMTKDGFEFYLSKNKVWLTDFVPVKYLSITNS